MDVQVWRSFSSNNSNSFYLVGRFASAEIAAEVAATLDAQYEECSADDDFYLWSEDEPPSHWVNGDTIVVYHDYCGGLYEVSLPGATTSEEEGAPDLGATLRFTEDDAGAEARTRLEAFFAQVADTPDTSDWKAPPWGGSLPYADATEDVAWWTDGRSAGFSLKYRDDLDGLRRFLGGPGIADFELRLCDEEHKARMELLAGCQQCPECSADDLQLTPAHDSVPEDQMVCGSCGGMFNLDALKLYAPITRVSKELFMMVRAAGDALLAVTWEGSIWRRRDVWEKVADSSVGLGGVVVLSENDALAVGRAGMVKRTRDGGTTWETIDVGSVEKLWSGTRTPSGTIYLCGDRGALVRSTDGGESWQAVNATKFDILDIAAASDNVLVGCCRFGKIIRSTDGGESWIVIQSKVETPLCRVHPIDEARAVIVGDRAVVMTTEDGELWRVGWGDALAGDLEDIIATRQGRLVVVSSKGEMLVSDDNGGTWERHGDPVHKKLRSVCEAASGDLIAVGEDGLVWRTTFPSA